MENNKKIFVPFDLSGGPSPADFPLKILLDGGALFLPQRMRGANFTKAELKKQQNLRARYSRLKDRSQLEQKKAKHKIQEMYAESLNYQPRIEKDCFVFVFSTLKKRDISKAIQEAVRKMDRLRFGKSPETERHIAVEANRELKTKLSGLSPNYDDVMRIAKPIQRASAMALSHLPDRNIQNLIKEVRKKWGEEKGTLIDLKQRDAWIKKRIKHLHKAERMTIDAASEQIGTHEIARKKFGKWEGQKMSAESIKDIYFKKG